MIPILMLNSAHTKLVQSATNVPAATISQFVVVSVVDFHSMAIAFYEALSEFHNDIQSKSVLVCVFF
jgi:hypothetical protein